MFADLIQQLNAKYGPVVVLIDEYDRPILHSLDKPEKAEAIRAAVREFYVIIKTYENLLKFVYITGLTKLTKTGIFSTMNNLSELTIDETYSCMMGITEDELETYFSERIDDGAELKGLSREDFINRIRNYYDGFSFDGKNFLYNPFSLACFFANYQFSNFWIDSGTSQALYEYIKRHNIQPSDYLHAFLQPEMLSSYEIDKAPPESFLFQSGYLTFKGVDEYFGYLLDYPNTEVKHSVSALSLGASYQFDRSTTSRIQYDIVTALRERNFDNAFAAMKLAVAAIPGKLHAAPDSDISTRELYYHSVLLTLLWGCGIKVTAEEWTARGISDMVMDFQGDIYVMELKLQSPEASIKQIRDKGYAEKYRKAAYLRLVGIEIDSEAKALKACKVETYIHLV
jgi:hypothetical protein